MKEGWRGKPMSREDRKRAVLRAHKTMQTNRFTISGRENRQPDGKLGCPGVVCSVPRPSDWLNPDNAASVRAYMEAPKCLVARAIIPAAPTWRAMIDSILPIQPENKERAA